MEENENRPQTLVLESETGDTLEFEPIASISLYEKTFLIAHPLNLDNVKEDEALVLEVFDEGEDVSYRIEEDEDTIASVFKEYYALFEKAQDEGAIDA